MRGGRISIKAKGSIHRFIVYGSACTLLWLRPGARLQAQNSSMRRRTSGVHCCSHVLSWPKLRSQAEEHSLERWFPVRVSPMVHGLMRGSHPLRAGSSGGWSAVQYDANGKIVQAEGHFPSLGGRAWRLSDCLGVLLSSQRVGCAAPQAAGRPVARWSMWCPVLAEVWQCSHFGPEDQVAPFGGRRSGRQFGTRRVHTHEIERSCTVPTNRMWPPPHGGQVRGEPAATVLALFLAPSAVLRLLGATRRGRVNRPKRPGRGAETSHSSGR